MRRAATVNRAIFAQWFGPATPNALFEPYVISDPVPEGWKWRILAASLTTTFPNNQGLYLFAIPPQLATRISNLKLNNPDDGSFFGGNQGGQQNFPPLKAAVQLSEGGVTAGAGGANDVFTQGSSNASVNVCMTARMVGMRLSLPARWSLLGYMSPPGGGGGGALTLRAMILPLPLL